MRLCFTSLAYPELSLADVLERAVRMGFDGVELRVSDDGIHVRPVSPIPHTQLELLKSYNIPVPVLSSYLRLSEMRGDDRDPALSLANNLVKLAAEIGASGLRVYGGEFPKASECVVNGYKLLARVAGDHGVRILIETHDHLADTSNIAELLDLSDEPLFLYDPANIIFAGGSHGEAFELLRGRIGHVHLKDFIVREGKRVFTRPGEGVVPLREIVSDLRLSGYVGYLSVEWERFWHRYLVSGDIILPLYRDYLRRLI
ncbi:MAG: sugar phosphate isomerase/epimerase family protein [Nitrososphaerota archaeon]